MLINFAYSLIEEMFVSLFLFPIGSLEDRKEEKKIDFS